MFQLIFFMCLVSGAFVAEVRDRSRERGSLESRSVELRDRHDYFEKIREEMNRYKAIGADTLEIPEDEEQEPSIDDFSDQDDLILENEDVITSLNSNPKVNRRQIEEFITDLKATFDHSHEKEQKSASIRDTTYYDSVMDDDDGDWKSYDEGNEDSLGNTSLWRTKEFPSLAYMKKVQEEGKCEHPKPRLVRVRSVHPTHTREYLPHCVILHRCADDTGCCLNNSHTCGPLEVKEVNLPVYIMEINNDKNIEEMLKFENHTKCGCLTRESKTRETRMKKKHTRFTSYVEDETEAPFLVRCHCPKAYSPQILPDGECECDCRDRDHDCLRLKKGKEHFGIADRLSIKRGYSLPPRCEFGDYNKEFGRCPRKEEDTPRRRFVSSYEE